MSAIDPVKALLELAESYRETKCRELQSAAQDRARELMRHSRRAARQWIAS